MSGFMAGQLLFIAIISKYFLYKCCYCFAKHVYYLCFIHGSSLLRNKTHSKH